MTSEPTPNNGGGTGVIWQAGTGSGVDSTVSSLPESIPATWLTQIREGVKADRPSVAWTLLGSSVLGAVIAAGSSFMTAYISSRANIELEMRKSALEEARLVNKEILDSYKALDQNLNDFRESYAGLITLLQIYEKKQQLKDKDVVAIVRIQMNGLGQKERALLDLKRDLNIDQSLWTSIERPVTSITAAMVASDGDLGNFLQNADKIKGQLTDAIKSERDAIASLRSKASGNPANQGISPPGL